MHHGARQRRDRVQQNHPSRQGQEEKAGPGRQDIQSTIERTSSRRNWKSQATDWPIFARKQSHEGQSLFPRSCDPNSNTYLARPANKTRPKWQPNRQSPKRSLVEAIHINTTARQHKTNASTRRCHQWPRFTHTNSQQPNQHTKQQRSTKWERPRLQHQRCRTKGVEGRGTKLRSGHERRRR